MKWCKLNIRGRSIKKSEKKFSWTFFEHVYRWQLPDAVALEVKPRKWESFVTKIRMIFPSLETNFQIRRRRRRKRRRQRQRRLRRQRQLRRRYQSWLQLQKQNFADTPFIFLLRLNNKMIWMWQLEAIVSLFTGPGVFRFTKINLLF